MNPARQLGAPASQETVDQLEAAKNRAMADTRTELITQKLPWWGWLLLGYFVAKSTRGR